MMLMYGVDEEVGFSFNSFSRTGVARRRVFLSQCMLHSSDGNGDFDFWTVVAAEL